MPGSGIDKIKKDLQDEYINEKTKLKNTNYGPAIVYQKNEKIVPAKVRKMMTGGDGTAYMGEATMTPAQKRKDTMLKKKYEKSDDMMKSFKDQYGKEKGENVFYAFIRKKSMEEENIQEVLDKKDVPFVKKLIKALKDGSITHLGQSKKLAKALKEQLGGVGPKVAPSSQEMKKKLTVTKEPLTKQSLETRKQDQANITDKMNQLGGITKTTSQNGKLDSMSIQGVGAGTNKDALKSVLAKSATGVKMDADGVVPDAGAVVQQQAMKGMNIAQNTIKK